MNKASNEKTVRVDMDIVDFNRILFWAFDHRHDSEEARLLYNILEGKLQKMIDHDLYHKYKTAPSPEAREAARKEYIERRGIPKDFTW